MKILLVSPSSMNDFISAALEGASYLRADAFFAPHSIAAVAAITPGEHEVHLHDEGLHGSVIPRLAREPYDVVGISLKANEAKRAFTIARAFRRMRLGGALVVGGIGVSLSLSKLAPLVDAVFLGEAETTWPSYLSDLREGTAKAVYRHAAKPDMSCVPPPRWDLIATDIPRYLAASVQTTRGCHFDCDFCDVIYTFGRTPRVKEADQVLGEVLALEKLGVRAIYFADDNFCTDRKEVKKLLRRLGELNNSFDEPIGFVTQVDITIARDAELLELLADANFMELQIGIESTNPNSLGELNKRSNVQLDLVDAVGCIQSYGIPVMAHLIIGADSDDVSAVDRTLEFIDSANVIHHFCHPLAAPPGTKLWYRLKREGRLVASSGGGLDTSTRMKNIDVLTNIVPKGMTRIELLHSLAEAWERGHDLGAHRRRVLRFIDGVRRVPRVRRAKLTSLWKNRKILASIMGHFFLSSSEHRRLFFGLTEKAGRRSPELARRVAFAHSNFLMSRARALDSARVAREQARWESEHPEQIVTLSRATPLPGVVRERAREIFVPAYRRVRSRTGRKQELYDIVIEAMVDYTDRFGRHLDEVDEQQVAYIHESCDRVMARRSMGAGGEGGTSLPVDGPPRGFVREILDGLDFAVRIRESAAAESS